jgi:P-type Ca2+ transporter type 2C
MDFHSVSIEQILSTFKTSPNGLSQDDVKKRREENGPNIIKEEKVPLWKLFIRQFHNILIYILFAASVVSLLLGLWGDFIVINIIIFINGIIAFWQEVKAKNAIEALRKMTEHRTHVIRQGQMQLIPSRELVPGDFVIFHEGEMVTADVRLTESASLMVDESQLTGESVPVSKDETQICDAKTLAFDQVNMLHTGTAVVRGYAKGIVVAIGEKTYLASIAASSQEKRVLTPLVQAIHYFSRKYIYLIVAFLLTFAAVGIYQNRPFIELGYILLASLVSVVPEGLPIVVTLVMVLGALKLSRKKTLVRYLPSVESLGSTSVIASDKTGTITEGSLVVQKVYTEDETKLKQIAALCNDAHEGKGDPVDLALADFVPEFAKLKKNNPRVWSYPFDPKNMLMATICNIDGQEQLLVKGAFEALKKKAKNTKSIETTEKTMHEMVTQGLRVLAFAYSEKPEKNPDQWELTLCGVIGFMDPPKEGVKEAVQFAKKAGIHVMMITGDHPLTAQAIAEEVAIYQKGDEVITGNDLEAMDDATFQSKLDQTAVFARILPDHKYRIVKALQDKGHIVAVTGDGVNDVPALRAAHLGIAMGSGTDVAKGASEMIITDNNLKVIVDAIRFGRVIADNIRKVIYYLLSTSLQEIVLIGSSIFSGLPIPLSAIHILWINIVTDGAQDKMFAFAKEESDVMEMKPKPPHKQFLDGRQIFRLLTFGVGMGLFTLLMFIYLLPIYPFKVVSTLVFTSVVTAQWANGVQAQKEREPFFFHLSKSFTINPLIYLGLGISLLLQCGALYLLPDLFHVVPITLDLWIYPLMSFGASFLLVEIRKWIEYFWDKR